MLDQTGCMQTVINKCNMAECKPVDTSLEPKVNFEQLYSDKYFDAPCRNLVRCLMYLR